MKNFSISIYKKERFNVTFVYGLSHDEFKCKCNSNKCRYTSVSKFLLDRFQNFRKDLNLPVAITSGFRCQSHNEKVGGVDNSYHTIGCAIDIKPIEKQKGKYLERYFNENHPSEPTTVHNDFDAIKYFAEKNGFHVIKYDSFLHLDVRQDII